MKAHVDQETFISNEGNKIQFILLQSHYLESDGHTVHTYTGDADTMIVSCAFEIANNGMEVNVVAEDTDVLILLMYHRRKMMSDVYFLSEPKRAQKKRLQVWTQGQNAEFPKVYNSVNYSSLQKCKPV